MNLSPFISQWLKSLQFWKNSRILLKWTEFIFIFVFITTIMVIKNGREMLKKNLRKSSKCYRSKYLPFDKVFYFLLELHSVYQFPQISCLLRCTGIEKIMAKAKHKHIRLIFSKKFLITVHNNSFASTT